MSSSSSVDPESILKLFSLYLFEHGEALLSTSRQFVNISEMSASNKHISRKKQLASMAHSILTECGMVPFLQLDYIANQAKSSSDKTSSSTMVGSNTLSGLIGKPLLDEWWDLKLKELLGEINGRLDVMM